jgi:predicted RNase H-like HicB family nuclease
MSKNEKEGISFIAPIIIEPDNGQFHAYCPILKGLHTTGDTIDEALDNAKNAIIAYLESLIKHGDPIPLCIIKKGRFSLKRLFHFKFHLYNIEVAVPA